MGEGGIPIIRCSPAVMEFVNLDVDDEFLTEAGRNH